MKKIKPIKFRGKYQTWDEEEYAFGDFTHDDFGKIYVDGYIVVEPDTIGQFTGAYDKKGAEIYEDDICEVAGDYKVVIRWDSENLRWYAELPDGEIFSIVKFCVANAGGFYKVIGNIHDNPGLLKEGEK